jgi:hypothetical protein
MPKISALNSIEQLTTSSILPVVDNNVTQKVTLQRVVEFVSASIDVTFATEIELLQSASSITSSLNAFASASVLSVATKLSTASFEAYTASVQSTNTSSLLLSSSFNTFTSSYKIASASFDSRIDNLELINVSPFLSASTFNTFTSSYTSHSSSFDNRLDIVEGINVSPFLSSSAFNTFSSSIKTFTSSINESVSSINSYTSSLKNAINVIGSGDLSVTTIYGNLHIEGTTTSVSASNLSITNNLIYLNDDNFATDPDLGIVGNYNDGEYAHTGIFSDASDGHKWKVFKGYTIEPSQSIDTSHGSYQLADFQANNIYGGIYATNGVISGSQQITDLGFVTTTTDIANFTFTTDTIRNGAITLQATNSDIVLNADGAVYIGSSNSGNQIITDSYLAGVIGDTEMVNNGTGNTITDNLNNIINSIPTIPVGTISGSEQITALGFISSSQTIDTSSLATSGSNTFNGSQSINGTLTLNISTGIPTGVTNWVGQGGWNQGFYSNISTTGGTGTGLTVDVAAGGGGYIVIEQITINNPGSGYTNGDIITIDNENNLPGTFTLQVGASTFEFDASGGLVFPDTTIQTTAFTPTTFVNTSSFNQFTSSLNNLISGSMQISELGFATTSSVVNVNTSSLVTTSSFNTYTASISTASLVTSITNLNTFSASINSKTGSYVTTGSNQFNANQSISGSITAQYNVVAGGYVQTPLIYNGGAIEIRSFYQPLQINSNGAKTIINDSLQVSSSLSVTGSIIGTIAATNGVISGSSQISGLGYALTSSLANVTPFLSSSTFNTFATSSNTFTASVNATTASLNTFSSSINTFTSSYTTHSSSFDSRINSIVNGSGFATTSSFNVYTASINTYSASINTYTSSMNSYTASINSTTASLNGKTGSYATTGSNQFKADQTITGSLTVTALTTISSSISANSSSLYLTSGSNLIVQNGGLVEITGSVTLSGSMTIQSGSIIMPNRPAFRVTGAGGPTYATTVLSSSMVVVDYNEGNHYNTSNGTFTAPIAGLYQVNLVCRTYSNSGAASQAVVVKNNTAGSNGTVQIMLEWAANTTVNHIGGSTISKLAVGDTLKAVVFMGSASFDANDNFSVAYIG